MGFRTSEYARIDNDTYVTPQWVWDCLYRVEPWAKEALDVCPANCQYDFLNDDCAPPAYYACLSELGVATNPPFKISEAIVRRALELTKPKQGRVAMLLPHAWDTAKGRVDLFEALNFKAKYVLTKRIRWENLEQKKNGPSSNHAWYVWDWDWFEQPIMGWISHG